MIYTDDNYYLLAFHTQKQEFRHYRVDRMDKVEEALYDREGREAFDKLDMADYTKYTFSMYQGDKQPVTMRFSNNMVDAVMDRFGRDVLMLKADDRHFDVTAVVSVSPQFFGCILTHYKTGFHTNVRNLLQNAFLLNNRAFHMQNNHMQSLA